MLFLYDVTHSSTCCISSSFSGGDINKLIPTSQAVVVVQPFPILKKHANAEKLRR